MKISVHIPLLCTVIFFSTLSSASPLLETLRIIPSAQSNDFVDHKKQFQLHTLLTEQRHPKTWNLSTTIQKDTCAGITMLLSVDEDISQKCIALAHDIHLLEQAADAIVSAVSSDKKIYIYGCGATGRLAKQMESTFWRPFCKKLFAHPAGAHIKKQFPNLENRLIGEMTGADRALISSLEGFEDLQLIGKLQLEDHRIQKGDVVFAITEGGETSSVIGTILAALNLYTPLTPDTLSLAQKNLYYIYNNPDSVLLPFERSRAVIENDAIIKIRLFTGPQSITGSTRMQATTSETFIMGIILEHALATLLKPHVNAKDFADLGFDDSSLREKLLSFIPLQKAVQNIAPSISQLTDLEAATYASKHFSTYFAHDALITVFIDSTERAPTFRLSPLDTVREQNRKSWIRVCTPAVDALAAWHTFLGRPFCGLDSALYAGPFSNQITDPYLQTAALNSLKNAGNDQQFQYDFSYPGDNNNEFHEHDLGIMVLLTDEIKQLRDCESPFQKFLKQYAAHASIGIILIPEKQLSETDPILQTIKSCAEHACIIQLPLALEKDPLKLRQHIGLKMLLNAHSTGVMAKLGRVVGNTMTAVNPGNLKLIGRATFLILSHVNDHLPEHEKISYRDANAVLFDAIDYAKQNQKTGQNAEVGLSIIRILEACRKNEFVSWQEVESIVLSNGLENYLQQFTL